LIDKGGGVDRYGIQIIGYTSTRRLFYNILKFSNNYLVQI
jgi:hypothetical protein